jgi:hypothetical protein
VTGLARLVPLEAPSPERLAGPGFAPYRELVVAFAETAHFPSAAELNVAFGDRIDRALGPRAVRFDAQHGKRRGRLASLEDAYEARIDARGLVPTRACLHDFANALVWARFPRSKRALAARQHRALRRDVPEFRGVLPNARSEERDVLAMLDEGAILLAGDRTFVFGHAILEHLASSDREVYGFPIEVAGADVEAIDHELASLVTDESRFLRRDAIAIGVRARLGSEPELDRVLDRQRT